MYDRCTSKVVSGVMTIECSLEDLHLGKHRRTMPGVSWEWDHTQSEYDDLVTLYKGHLALCRKGPK